MDNTKFSPVTTYLEAEDLLFAALPMFTRVGKQAIKPGLDNIIKLLEASDNPQNTYKIIHVAGTNGKGSTSNMLAAILQSAGYKVGLHTSPHLQCLTERFRVNGKEGDKQFVIDYINQNCQLINEVQPSFFELTVAMSLLYFKQQCCEIAVVEVGVGGRLDSTNIVNPILSVITNISYDHADLLGNTLPKIAAEKAGIIKANVPVIVSEWQTQDISDVFIAKAIEQDSKLTFASETVNIKTTEAGDYILNRINLPSLTVKPSLTANYQLKNISGVVAACNSLTQLGIDIPDEAIIEGLENVETITGFKGRWQILNKKPLTIADTGHNEAGIGYVIDMLAVLMKTHTQLHIVFGVVADKEVSKILAMLPKLAQYYFCKPNIPRGKDAQLLLTEANLFGLKGTVYHSVSEAFNAAKINAKLNDVIFIGGSTFVVAEI